MKPVLTKEYFRDCQEFECQTCEESNRCFCCCHSTSQKSKTVLRRFLGFPHPEMSFESPERDESHQVPSVVCEGQEMEVEDIQASASPLRPDKSVNTNTLNAFDFSLSFLCSAREVFNGSEVPW